MVQQLHEESAVWITKDNIEQRITGRLFDDYATTGLVTRTSNYWRYMTIPYVMGKDFGKTEARTQPKNGKYYANPENKGGMNPMERKYQYVSVFYSAVLLSFIFLFVIILLFIAFFTYGFLGVDGIFDFYG